MSNVFAFSTRVRQRASQFCTVPHISGSGCSGKEVGQKHAPVKVRRNRLLWRMKMASTYRAVEASATDGLAAPSALHDVTCTKEASLLATAKSGEPAALDALYRAHREKLFRTVHRITRNREDAEDAVQDALLRAFLHLKSFDGRSTFSTWLTRIGINSALMILRKNRNSREISAHGPGVDETLWKYRTLLQIPEYGAQSESGKDFFETQLRVYVPGVGALLSFIRSKAIRCRKRQRKSAFRFRPPRRASFTPKRPCANLKCCARSTSPVGMASRSREGSYEFTSGFDYRRADRNRS